MITFLNRCIRWFFYALFFFVPLVVVSDTSELFEFNKLWLTFGITIIIGALWISKMILQKRIFIQRTPLDIPILLFLLSQIISTIFSLDQHVSWWGYYSRFNGGLASMLCYIFLYYALASNLSAKIQPTKEEFQQDAKKFIFNIIKVSLFAGLTVSLWGFPSHFGYDPTCYLFRGTLDVACWTDAFQPKVRIFSTLGQPDWLAAYLAILLPIAIAFAINFWKQKNKLLALGSSLLAILLYVDILYTRSKGTFLSLIAALLIFCAGYWWIASKKSLKPIFVSIAACLVITFIVQTPFDNINHYLNVSSITQKLFPQKSAPATKTTPTQAASAAKPNMITGELGGTDSGKIRLFVWQGALDIWLHSPLFGSGTETFAFAYYQYRPAGHNLTSEWDYLYNKAHNEYLNYLATTGIFGLGTYLAIIIVFLWIIVRYFLREEKKQDQTVWTRLVILGILSGYISILVSNFFGFSVVMVNIYFFLIPLFVLVIANLIDEKKIIAAPQVAKSAYTTHTGQWLGIVVIWILALYMIAILFNYWLADKSYALGYNLDRIGQYQMAFKPLSDAYTARPGEPVYKDELATNNATLALAYANQKDSSTAAQLAQEALKLSTENVTDYPNNVLFWKTRTRVLYSLSQLDPQYMPMTLQAIQKAHELAPTDAKIDYNLGLIYQQNGQLDNAVKALQETVKLKPDYHDAYYALGLILHQQALSTNGKTIANQDKQKQAVAALEFILQNISPDDTATKKTLQTWGVNVE